MVTKNKKSQAKLKERLQVVSAHISFILMASAATVMTLEGLQHRENHRVVMPSQPSQVHAQVPHEIGGGHERREREETGPHFISYGASQRTAARAGRA